MSARIATLMLLVACGCSGAPGGEAGIDAAAPDAAALDASPGDAGEPADPRTRCDEEGEVCCADGTCEGTLPCNGGLCGFVGCGDIGAPCCAAGWCRLLSGAVCEDGMCVEPHCGSEGFECCASGPACREELVCHEGACLRCGALGESCCPGETCDGDLYCLAEGGTLGQCILEAPPCGASGERCCPEGAQCGAGLGCQDGMCAPGPACGAERRACCDEGPRCGTALVCGDEGDGVERCQRCGEYELPCCEGAQPCGPGLLCETDSVCRLPS